MHPILPGQQRGRDFSLVSRRDRRHAVRLSQHIRPWYGLHSYIFSHLEQVSVRGDQYALGERSTGTVRRHVYHTDEIYVAAEKLNRTGRNHVLLPNTSDPPFR